MPVREALITIGNVENIPEPEVAEKVYGLREKLLLDVKEVAKESADNVVWESDLSKREVATDQMLRETKILAERAGNANESKATPFYTFADDINFDDARHMASKS